MKINENQENRVKSMAIDKNHWKSMTINKINKILELLHSAAEVHQF